MIILQINTQRTLLFNCGRNYKTKGRSIKIQMFYVPVKLHSSFLNHRKLKAFIFYVKVRSQDTLLLKFLVIIINNFSYPNFEHISLT